MGGGRAGNANGRQGILPDAGACDTCGAADVGGREGCQRLFDEVLGREFGDARFAGRHRLTVDAYSLQHPERYMRSGKSFAAHLTGAWAAFEGEDAAAINRAVRSWLDGSRQIDLPEPPPGRRGDLTVRHLLDAAGPDEHVARVLEWARSAWEAWRAHHDRARRWVTEATGRDESSPR